MGGQRGCTPACRGARRQCLLHSLLLHLASHTHTGTSTPACPPACSDLNNTRLWGALPPSWGNPDAMPSLDAL